MGRGKRKQTGSGAHAPAPQDFNPEVSFGAEEVVIWLPELLIGGNGANFEAAKADLITELNVYAAQFRVTPSLHDASNRRQHAALLERLEAAQAEGKLEELLFAAPDLAVPVS
jgi:hypothetical protein